MRTVAQYLPLVRAATPASSVRVYDTYWNLMVKHLGDEPLDDVLPSQISRLALLARDGATVRRTHRDGISAQEHFVGAARRFFAVAMADGLVSRNPATLVPKPKRAPGPRFALSHAQVREIFEVCSDEENHMLRFLLETGARREGLLNMTPLHVRPARQTVMLDEKNSRVREQPITAAMAELLSDSDCSVYAWTRRRLDGLWVRTRRAVPWADEIGLSTHWIRHTSVTWMEQVAGYSVAATFAGHVPVGTTGTYVTVTIHDVAKGFSRLFGEPHPLASG